MNTLEKNSASKKSYRSKGSTGDTLPCASFVQLLARIYLDTRYSEEIIPNNESLSEVKDDE